MLSIHTKIFSSPIKDDQIKPMFITSFVGFYYSISLLFLVVANYLFIFLSIHLWIYLV